MTEKERIIHRPHKKPTAHCGLCGGAVPLTDEYEDRRTVDEDGNIFHTACWNNSTLIADKTTQRLGPIAYRNDKHVVRIRQDADGLSIFVHHVVDDGKHEALPLAYMEGVNYVFAKNKEGE